MTDAAGVAAEISAVFELFKDIAEPHGSLSPRDLRNAIRALGSERTNEDVRQMLIDLGKDPDSGTMSGEEFQTVMTETLANRDPTEVHQKAFQLIDEGATGSITAMDLKRVAETLGESIDNETLNEMLMSADLDSDGMLNLDEFYRVMSKSTMK